MTEHTIYEILQLWLRFGKHSPGLMLFMSNSGSTALAEIVTVYRHFLSFVGKLLWSGGGTQRGRLLQGWNCCGSALQTSAAPPGCLQVRCLTMATSKSFSIHTTAAHLIYILFIGPLPVNPGDGCDVKTEVDQTFVTTQSSSWLWEPPFFCQFEVLFHICRTELLQCDWLNSY